MKYLFDNLEVLGNLCFDGVEITLRRSYEPSNQIFIVESKRSVKGKRYWIEQRF